MIYFHNTEVTGWEAAIRGMRNPLESWDKSDSEFDFDGVVSIGPEDLKLMNRLALAGDDHGKFLRMINVTVDIAAPLYWWKEFDTYKVGTVANSRSTMHKLHSRDLTMHDFSTDKLDTVSKEVLQTTIDAINKNRELYLATEDKHYWWCMIQLLPSSYMQVRTVQLNYQTIMHMMRSRRGHKLDEWSKGFMEWALQLPYIDILEDKH